MTEKKEHPYAVLLRWIADGEEIQVNYKCVWSSINHSALIRSIDCGSAYKDEYYRIKPKTIRIGKYDVAEPMKEKPDDSCAYFYLDASQENGINSTNWTHHEADNSALESGMCWLNPEDAELAAKAIKELLTGQ